MTTSSPVKKEYDIPIIEFPEPKRLNPGTSTPIIIRSVPVKVPVKK